MIHTSTSNSSNKSIFEFGLALAQLFRLPVSLIAALAGFATCDTLNPSLPQGNAYRCATILFCLTAAACAINDYKDVDKDRINHPDRPLPAGRLSPSLAWWGAVILFALALLTALSVGGPPGLLVGISIVLLWNYSHLLKYSGVLGNLVVASLIALLILLGSMIAGQPFRMIYPTAFVFCYALAREVVWDIHDAEGDRQEGVITVANGLGIQAAFKLVWVLVGMLLLSLPLALSLLSLAHPLRFAGFVFLMLLSFALPLAFYQIEQSEVTYERLVFCERLAMVLGVIGLLGAAPL